MASKIRSNGPLQSRGGRRDAGLVGQVETVPAAGKAGDFHAPFAKRMAECRADAAGVSDDRRAHFPLRYEGWQMARNQRDVQFAL